MNNEKPGDLYSHVAAMVELRVQADCLNEETKYNEIAKKLKGNINRKIIK